jgi:hypothetical protein
VVLGESFRRAFRTDPRIRPGAGESRRRSGGRQLSGEYRRICDPFAGARGACRLLDPITQDACAFYEDHALFDDYTGVVYETSEGDRIAQTLGNSKAVILRNHGLLTVGKSIDEAVWWFITMDRSCHAQLLAEAAGQPIRIAHEHAVTARNQVGDSYGGWFQFQPLWSKIAREEPDLFD